jgi:8-oxo-dGTP pyrophosphatase MutT (NUDIX family)
MKTLDFPKGKANECEEDVECAIREIKEEINLDVKSYIKDDQYISV